MTARRRRFWATAAVTALVATSLSLSGLGAVRVSDRASADPAPPAPAAPAAGTATPIAHFVYMMQTGHSFDSYFGTYPGADGIPPGTCLPLDAELPDPGTCVRPYPVGNEPPEPLDRTAQVQRHQYDSGKMDGFVWAYRRLGLDGRAAMGYADGETIPYYWNLADRYTLFDRFFSSALVGTRNNALYAVAGTGTPDGTERVPPAGFDLPTIFDRLQERGVSWKVYVENRDLKATYRTNPAATARLPLESIPRFVDDPVLAAHTVDLSEYERDVAGGTLPAVAYVIANGSSENAPGRVATGQALVRRIVDRLQTSDYWASSAFLLTYNGWGGYYDHVPPPFLDKQGPGFRVPALLVSPYARHGFVDHTTMDYTAALKFIETNWRVPSLATRDARSPGLASAFDFSAPPRPAELVGTERGAAAPVNRQARVVVYGTYAAVLAVAAAVAWLPGGPLRRLSRRLSPGLRVPRVRLRPPGRPGRRPPPPEPAAPSAPSEPSEPAEPAEPAERTELEVR